MEIKLERKCIFLFMSMCLWMTTGCGDKNATIQPPGASPQVAPKGANIQLPPATNIDKTRSLFSLATERKLGDKFGLVEMRNEGILIHPGETSPTRVSFKISRSFQSVVIRPFIASLPTDAPATEAGTVGVEFLLDGKSSGRIVVDRASKQINTLNLVNVDLLTVVVDNGDGKPWFDWLMIAVVDLK
jgi:hypothetical protein